MLFGKKSYDNLVFGTGSVQSSNQKIGTGALPGDIPKKGTIAGQLDEWFKGPSSSSAAGLQREENVKARDHASAERLASEAFNASEAQKAREHAEYLSNTSYQRMMADLKEAGINPMFAINQGGASTPSSAQARSSASPSGASGTTSQSLMKTILPLMGLVIAGVNSGAKAASVGTNTAISGKTIAPAPKWLNAPQKFYPKATLAEQKELQELVADIMS